MSFNVNTSLPVEMFQGVSVVGDFLKVHGSIVRVLPPQGK